MKTETQYDPLVDGGDHYKQGGMQPLEFITVHNIPYCRANIIKYLTRYRYKGTPLQDLVKVKDYLRKASAMENIPPAASISLFSAQLGVENYAKANGLHAPSAAYKILHGCLNPVIDVFNLAVMVVTVDTLTAEIVEEKIKNGEVL